MLEYTRGPGVMGDSDGLTSRQAWYMLDHSQRSPAGPVLATSPPYMTTRPRLGSLAMAWPLRGRGQMPGSGYVQLVHLSIVGSYSHVSSSSPSPSMASRWAPPNMITVPAASSKTM